MRERGSPGGEPRRIGETEKRGSDRRKFSSSPAPPCSRCPRCWTRFANHRREQSGYEGTGKKTRFRASESSGVRARDPRSFERATRRTSGKRNKEEGVLRTVSSPLPSVPSVSSVVKQEREGGGRIGDRESAGSRGVFPDHHRGHRGHRGGKRGLGFGFAGRSRARSRERGPRRASGKG